MSRWKTSLITPEMVLEWEPCEQYTPERLHELLGRGIPPREVLHLDIPPTDRLWAVLQPEVIRTRDLSLLASIFAERVLPMYERWYPHDSRLRQAIDTSRRYVLGQATEDELDAVYADVRAATDATASAYADVRAATDATASAYVDTHAAAAHAAARSAYAAARAAYVAAADTAAAYACAAAADTAAAYDTADAMERDQQLLIVEWCMEDRT